MRSKIFLKDGLWGPNRQLSPGESLIREFFHEWFRLNMKGALIISITGQAGGDLAEFLLEIGYEIHGQKRK